MALEQGYYIASIGVFLLMLLSALGVDLKRITRMNSVPNGKRLMVFLAVIGIALGAAGVYSSFRSRFDGSVDTQHPIMDRTFRNEQVFLDGKSFYRCRFENVTFRYSGRRGFAISHCAISGIPVIQCENPTATLTVGLLVGLGFVSPNLKIVTTGPPAAFEPPKVGPAPKEAY
jgi:hypothetical protein